MREAGLFPVQDGPISESDPYPRYKPGDYEVICEEAKIYRDPQFRRLVCRLRCALVVDPEKKICCFLNLGNLEKPTAGRRSNYRRAWVIANGEQPKRRQILSKRTFVGKIFLVSIGDVANDMDGRELADFEKYSVIQEIKARL